MGYKSIGLVCSSLLLTIIVQICYIIYVRKNLHLKPKYNNMPKQLIKEILLFSFWVFLANVVNQLYNSTDTLIIGSVPALATVGVAIYNIGATFSSMMTNISLGMLNVLTPKVNMLVFKNASNTELTDLMIRIGRLQCYIVTLVCSGFIAFGMPFIYIWAGKGYEDAYWVALVTMIPGCVPLIQNIAMNVIVAQNKHRFRSLVYLAIALVNVVGTLLCVEPFGIVGAAVVSGISFVIGQIFIMNWYYWKKIELDIPRFWKSVLPLFIGPLIMCIITLFISKFVDFYNVKILLIGIISYAVIYVLYNWIVIMNQYEKDIFVVPVKKILNKFRKKV